MIAFRTRCSNEHWMRWLGQFEDMVRCHLTKERAKPSALVVWMNEQHLPDLVKMARLNPGTPAYPIAMRMVWSYHKIMSSGGRLQPIKPEQIEMPMYSEAVCAADSDWMDKV